MRCSVDTLNSVRCLHGIRSTIFSGFELEVKKLRVSSERDPCNNAVLTKALKHYECDNMNNECHGSLCEFKFSFIVLDTIPVHI